jgi:hypothetical protein
MFLRVFFMIYEDKHGKLYLSKEIDFMDSKEKQKKGIRLFSPI